MEDQSVLNPLDIIIVGVIIFGMYVGAKRGVFKLTTRLASIILGILAGLRFWWVAQSIYIDSLKLDLNNSSVMLLSFLTVFIVSYVVISRLLGWMDDKMGKNYKVDDALGAIVGGGVATLLLSFAFILLSYVSFPSEANARGSVLYPHVRNFSRIALGVGVNALREANQQVNKYGLQQTVPSVEEDDEEIRVSNKPTPVR